MRGLAPFLLCSLIGCAANNAQMTARAVQQNEASRTAAERALFERGQRPLNPQPALQTLVLRGVNASCSVGPEHAAAEPVEVLVGHTPGQTTYEAACALATQRESHLRARLANESDETLLTYVPWGSSFAIAASGKITRYTLVPRRTEVRRGFEKGTSCCCGMPLPPYGDANLEVIVGPYPATEEELVPYDTVEVIFCAPSAPQ